MRARTIRVPSFERPSMNKPLKTTTTTIASLIAAATLSGGMTLPATAQDAPSSAPTVSTTSNAGSLDAKAANVKRIDIDTVNFGTSFAIGTSDNMAWEDGAWVGRAYRTPILGENDLTMTASVTYKDGTKSKRVQLAASGFNADTPVPLGTTKANSRQFSGVVDGMPIRITYATYDAEPIGFWNLDRASYAMRKAGDDTYRFDYQHTFEMFKNQNGDGWQGSCEKVIFYNPDREGFNGHYDTLPSLLVTWGEPQKAVENGRHLLKSVGTAKGEIAGQKVEIILHAAADDPEAEDTNGTWTFVDADGVKTNLLYKGGAMSSNFTAAYDRMPKTLTATNSDGMTVTLDRNDWYVTTKPGDQLGVDTITGTIRYTAEANGEHPAFQIFGNIKEGSTTGTPITIKDGSSFTKGDDGLFTATDTNYTLDSANKPNTDKVILSNGDTAPITWDGKVETITQTIDGADVKFLRMNGTAEGKIGEQSYRVQTVADRAYNDAITAFTITQTNAKGESKTITLTDFNPAKHDYAITLPASAVGDSFALATQAGVDATVGTPTVTLDGASRILKVEVNGIPYTVRVNFAKADIVADSPAKLEGIYVDYSGKDVKGDLIDDWNPNRLDYTIALKDANQSPYLLPIAPDGVNVKAGNVVQSAQSTRQEWIVTDTASGTSRTYSVTVTRPVHTAVTDFQPKTPIVQTASVEADSDADTNLASVGYVDASGKYVPQNSAEFRIPEGGVFSYEAKVGQSSTVTVARDGMTFTYTVNVLAPNGQAFAQHVYKATYLTPATNKAVLDGISVDGKAVEGFDPKKLEYEVKVADPDEWTVVAQYDKASGMSVAVDKHGADAVLTVTSGDGLVKTVYKVHAVAGAKGAGSSGVALDGQLANTGVNTGMVAALAGALVAIGAVLYACVLRLRRNRKNVNDDQSDKNAGRDVTDTGGDGSSQSVSDSLDG